LKRHPLQESVVHFATHGVFPSRLNPYEKSGLLVASEGQLPKLAGDKDHDYSRQGTFLLSPKRLLASELDVSGAHITLQACVSGYSKEGVGGDALGLEWAFIQSGASSILSSYWDVNIDYAVQFSILFYQYWLCRNYSRREAHRQATLDLLRADLPADLPAPYYWAAFGLSGDWR
jgi:CHAT domain-containing protein